jgi:hypothetical protein
MTFPLSPSIGDTHTEEDTLWTYGNTGWYRTTIGSDNDTKYTFGPSLESLNDVDLDPPPSDGDALVYDQASDSWIPGAAGATAAGNADEIQYNDGASGLAASPDLTWDDTGKVLEVGGDINLDDGGTYTTTLQVVTPTANRTISYPDATGTVALVAGSTSQLIYNNAGVYAGLSNVTTDGTNLTIAGRWTNSTNGALSATGIAGVPVAVTGTWIATGGTSTTTKPQFLVEPTGATSTAWSTAGTGIGVNAASTFTGSLIDLQVNGTSNFLVSGGAISRCSQINLPQQSGGTGIQTSLGGGASGLFLGADLSISWSSGVGTGAFSIFSSGRDLYILRDAANTLAQRNGTNAQAFRVYGTFTDASNHVRAALSSTSTAVTLAAETAGTGADDIPLNLTAAGTGTIKVNSVAEVVVSSTVAGLPAAPVVGMLTRVTDATAPAVGSTVAGGGAAAALCWYNGANWSVIGV